MNIKNLSGTAITAISIVFIVIQTFSPAFAHLHDDVATSVISPSFSEDNTIYSLVRTNVFKSTNGGASWKRLIQGLDNKPPITSLAIDPKSPNILYLSTRFDGIYKSENAGSSWHKINHGLDTLNIEKIYIPPAASHAVAFAAGFDRALYKTANGGENWIKVYDNPVPLSAIAGFGWSLSKGRELLIGDRNGNLFFSADAGHTWNKIHAFSGCGEITSIGTSRNLSMRNIFFVGTDKCGIFRTVDSGKSFHAANNGITDLNIRAVAVAPNNAAIVFAVTWFQAVFVSTDAGLTWQKHAAGITISKQADEHGLPHFHNISFSPNFKNDQTVFLSAFAGLFKAVDGGTQWNEKHIFLPTLIQSIAISPAYATDKTIAFTTYAGGIYQSTDAGSTWRKIAENIDSRNDDIAFSPSFLTDGTMFATIGKDIVGKSIDRGKSWVSNTIPMLDFPTIIALSPAFADDSTVFIATRHASIYRSTDAGVHFTSVFDKRSVINNNVSGFVISPNYTHDRTLVVALVKGDIYMTGDGGVTWTFKGSAATFGNNIKLVISPDYAIDRTIFIASTKGLFRTTDGFKTWEKISCATCDIDGNIETLELSPNYKIDKTVILTIKGKGLFKSVNRGETFQQIGSALIKRNYIFSSWDAFPTATSSTIKFSPAYATDKTIYGTSSDRLYRSRDGGKTWDVVVFNAKLGEHSAMDAEFMPLLSGF